MRHAARKPANAGQLLRLLKLLLQRLVLRDVAPEIRARRHCPGPVAQDGAVPCDLEAIVARSE